MSEELRLLQRQVESFALKEVAPLARDADIASAFPLQLWPRLGELGLLGITVSAQYGGAGLGYLAQVLVMQSLSRASASIGLSYAAHANLCVNQIFLNGTATQCRQYLPALIAGTAIGALAMSETQAGSDVMAMSLTAERHGEGYCLNGHKMWITNGPDADVIVVYARTKQGEDAAITAFIVQRDFSGFSCGEKLDKLGMRGSNTCQLFFENCTVPAESILGTLHQGAKVLMSGLDYERVVLAAGPVGIMQNCLDLILPYIHQRKQFGKCIGEFELMQAKLADIYAQFNACQAYLYAVATACDHQQQSREDAAAVILYCAEQATAVALQTIQIFGANGYMNDYDCGRLLRDAKLYEIGAGTSEIRRMLIGRELFQHSQ